MTKEELKEQFAIECTETDLKGRTVVKGTPMDIINWIADKFCQLDVIKSVCEHQWRKDAGSFRCIKCGEYGNATT